MTTHVKSLNTREGEIVVKDRLWPMHSPDPEVPGAKNTSEVLVFDLARIAIGKNPMSFDQFDPSNNSALSLEAVMQLMFHGVETLRNSLRAKNPAPMECTEFPISVYIETVQMRPGARIVDTEDQEEEREKLRVMEFLAELTRSSGVTVESLMQGAKSEERESRMACNDISKLEFMKGHREDNVYSYRFWFVITEPSISLSEEIARILKSNFDGYVTNFGPGAANVFNSKKKRAFSLFSESSSTSSTNFLKDIDDNQRYCCIYSPDIWLHVIAVYNNDERYVREWKKKCMAPKKSLEDSGNPASPNNIFCPTALFDRLMSSRLCCDDQRRLENYINGNDLTFPRPSCVMRVDTTLWKVSAIRRMYTPDWQLNRVEPFLDWSQLENRPRAAPQPIPRVIAESMRDDSDEDIVIENEIDVRAGEDADVLDLRILDDESESPNNDPNRVVWNADDLPSVDRATTQVQPLSLGVRLTIQEDVNPTSSDGNVVVINVPKTQIDTLKTCYTEGEARVIEKIPRYIDRSREMMLMRVRCFDVFKTNCMDTHSNVPSGLLTFNKWLKVRQVLKHSARGDKKALTYKVQKGCITDRKMSIFGAMVADEIQAYETLFQTHTAQISCLLVRIAILTGHQIATDVLRLNLIFVGAFGTSKSWAMTLLRNIMMDSTTEDITTVSKQSDVRPGGDYKTQVHEELPDKLILKRGADEDLKNATKNWLTSNKHTRKITDRDYNTRSIETVKHLSVIGATNRKVHELDPHVASRAAILEVFKCNRQFVDMSQKQIMAHQRDRRKTLAKRIFIDNMQLRQCILGYINWGIPAGWCNEPTLGVYNQVYPRYKKVLEQKFGLSASSRTNDRIRPTVRALTIDHAITWLYTSPSSPLFEATYFSPWHLMVMDPFLHDTEEIVYFVLDLFRNELIDNLREKVLQCISDDLSFFFKRNTSFVDLFVTQQEMRQATLNPTNAGTKDGDKRYDTTTSVLRAASAPTVPERTREWNYVRFRKSLDSFSASIASKMGANKSGLKPDASAVKMCLKKLTTTSIRSGEYVAPIGPAAKIHNKDAIKPSGPILEQKAAKILGDRAFMIHSSFIFGKRVDQHEFAIKRCFTPCTPHKSAISGFKYSDDHPYLFQMRQLCSGSYLPNFVMPTSEDYEEFNFEGGILSVYDLEDYYHRNSESAHHEQCGSNITLDSYSTRKRLECLKIPITPENVARCNMAKCDANDTKTMRARTNRYPEFFAERERERYKRSAGAAFANSDVDPEDASTSSKRRRLGEPHQMAFTGGSTYHELHGDTHLAREQEIQTSIDSLMEIVGSGATNMMHTSPIVQKEPFAPAVGNVLTRSDAQSMAQDQPMLVNHDAFADDPKRALEGLSSGEEDFL